MTHHHHTSETRPMLLVGLLVAIAAFAGCLGGGEPEPSSDLSQNEDGADGLPQDPTNGTGDMTGDDEDSAAEDAADNETEPDVCSPVVDLLYADDYDGAAVPDPAGWDPESDPMMLTQETVQSTFTVYDDITDLYVALQAGAHATPGWTVVVEDPNGEEAYRYDGAAGVDPAGAIEDNAEVAAPTPGEWTLTIIVTGYVEGLTVKIDAETCV